MSISILVILVYPFILMWVRDMLYPPSGAQCGNPDMMFVMFNVIIGLPAAIFFQWIFNWWLLSPKKTS